MATDAPRVKLITIDGLFRQYDHRIPLRLGERVTVLHGRNGVGKTVTLALVAALLGGDYVRLAKVPFKRLRMDFTDGSFLSANRGAAKRTSKRAAPKLMDQLGRGDLRIEYSIQDSKHTESWPLGDFLAFLNEDGSSSDEPEELRRCRKRFLVHFVEAQRLFRIVARPEPWSGDAASRVTSAVTDIANEMATRVQQSDSTYRSTSTRLDDSLPARLFSPPKNGGSLSDGEVKRRTEVLEAERRRLHEIGLLADTTSFNPSTLNKTQRAMFAVYLKDNEEKLAVFKDLADRAEILLGILNRKLAPKRIVLDKDQGYKVQSHDGLPLALDALSSGEQHELVLLHTLLFRVEPGALLLIDEPELSLHVTWQSEFLSELIQIAKKVGFDALVATHSPYIVGEHRDLMVRLGEPV